MTSLSAEKLSHRLWRELNQAKYQDTNLAKKLESTERARQQDMAWLEETIDTENTSLGKEETVEQVMAEFNREQKQNKNATANTDSISLKLAAPQRKFQRGASRSPALAPQSRKKLRQEYEYNLKKKALENSPLTRQRNR